MFLSVATVIGTFGTRRHFEAEIIDFVLFSIFSTIFLDRSEQRKYTRYIDSPLKGRINQSIAKFHEPQMLTRYDLEVQLQEAGTDFLPVKPD